MDDFKIHKCQVGYISPLLHSNCSNFHFDAKILCFGPALGRLHSTCGYVTNTVVYMCYTRDLPKGKLCVLRDIENFKLWPKLKEMDGF